MLFPLVFFWDIHVCGPKQEHWADTWPWWPSEGPQQAGEVGKWEPHKAQQVKMQSPAPGKESLHTPVCDGGQQAGKQLSVEPWSC